MVEAGVQGYPPRDVRAPWESLGGANRLIDYSRRMGRKVLSVLRGDGTPAAEAVALPSETGITDASLQETGADEGVLDRWGAKAMAGVAVAAASASMVAGTEVASAHVAQCTPGRQSEVYKMAKYIAYRQGPGRNWDKVTSCRSTAAGEGGTTYKMRGELVYGGLWTANVFIAHKPCRKI
jgi:hypothetical protein